MADGSHGHDEPAGDAGVDDDLLTGRTLWVILLLAVIAGAVAGFLGSAFRWLLEHIGAWRGELVEWSHGHSAWAWLVTGRRVRCCRRDRTMAAAVGGQRHPARGGHRPR
ncbi:hypothetical protein QSJ19_12125 [Gordonia sp. ABSL11-1]|uniref:hypothetical protein n=1 Tax=Gordonia sp. ABSL11-1 TaxID=3053924 RepID=UPI002573621D|nr:hypothetical protein [Gordonia sp. ABSL11-1]MDL9946329.1 hypothetical protein [Gordonia sp. ABSL11-1]